jgi:hypothetical protein
VDIDYTPDGVAQVAETIYKGRRLIVRRTRLVDPAQLRLWPDWRYHAFLTDLEGSAVELDAFRRRHAVVELAIRDLKEGAGLEHVPSGRFHANAAWLACAVLAHNLIRWTSRLGSSPPRLARGGSHHAHPVRDLRRPHHQPLRHTDAASRHSAGPGPNRSSPLSAGSASSRPPPDSRPPAGTGVPPPTINA